MSSGVQEQFPTLNRINATGRLVVQRIDAPTIYFQVLIYAKDFEFKCEMKYLGLILSSDNFFPLHEVFYKKCVG